MTVRHKTRFVARFGGGEHHKGFAFQVGVEIDKEELLKRARELPEGEREKALWYLRHYKEGKNMVVFFFYKYPPTANSKHVLDDLQWRNLRPCSAYDLKLLPNIPQLKRRVVVAPFERVAKPSRSDCNPAMNFRAKDGPKPDEINTITGSSTHKKYVCYLAALW